MTDDVVIPADLLDVATRYERMVCRGTASPPFTIDAPPVTPIPAAPRWNGAWWPMAMARPAHFGRVGAAIRAWGVIVHTTDMLPGEQQALVDAWTTRPGDGACAHFLIGRDEGQGVIQFVPIDRNGNHAGGLGHGVYRVPSLPPRLAAGDRDLHPNLVTVGIELHCAGGVRKVDGLWRLVEDGKAHGPALPDADVIPDPQRPGRGWHRVTDYQLERLGALLDDLDAVLAPVPDGVTKVAFGETPPAYAVIPGARLATHAELDPVHRADPWPQVSDWLKARVAR